MLIIALFVIGGGFTAYALYTQYQRTSINESVPARVWASVMAAAAAIGAAVMAWLHSVTAP